ncbi:MAG: helix-turn-helix transcriptional regulator [Rudanella sp.]|nr:helix-turn-helix transcriptional regulator [Rudanella sp.]
MITQTNSNDVVSLRIRGMVCARCIDVVRDIVQEQNLVILDIRLGQVHIQGLVAPESLDCVRLALAQQGFALLTDTKATIVQRTKTVVEQILNRDDLGDHKIRYSDAIVQQIPMDYPTLSALFSAQEGITLEKYIINRRLDKVRELLVYTDQPLTDIAYRTGFSSASHLSNQFKRLTGLTPSYFRQVRQQKQALQQGMN